MKNKNDIVCVPHLYVYFLQFFSVLEFKQIIKSFADFIIRVFRFHR